MYPEYALLSRHIRSGLVEEEHFGLILKISDKGEEKIIGNDNDYSFCLRSCMKPLQAAAISEVFEAFDFTEQEIAVTCASHTGEKYHIETVKNILNKIGCTEDDLLCPPQQPLSLDAQKELIINGKEASKLHNNCSGKHAGMLAYCKLKGFDIKNYNDFRHPLQKQVLNFVARICQTDLKNCTMMKDGCTLPVLAMPLKNFGTGFLKMFSDENYSKITNAILNNPYYFGGVNRLDSEIVKAGGGKLIAKVGAGNLCAVADISSNEVYIIKLSDGDNYSRGLILSQYLNKLGKFSDFSKLSEIFRPYLFDENKQPVGEILFFFNK